jgi:1,3-beta-glucan synthase
LQLDNLVQQREDIVFRLGYDDINESLTHPDIVRRTLLALGASKDAIHKGNPHGALHGIMQLGVLSQDGHHDPSVDQKEGILGSYDTLRAAVFWSSQVFVKTYYERRRSVHCG